ncbi:MAG: CaiB/BaiF CoA transferase family protein [Planctomycetota bacterium]|jgi:formyl-CoA transferase
MSAPIVLSHEAALALPYATARLVQQGWRVIRLESPAGKPGGDPNRRVGAPVAGPDRCAYFVGPNAGKESVALDLSTPEGQAVLDRLLTGLQADVFCSNARPRTHARLGVTCERLQTLRPELIWVGLSAAGPEHPDAAGYDPAVQAESGVMAVNGHPDGPPTLCGLPVADLRAGDEVVLQVALALAERASAAASGDPVRGRRIDVALSRALIPWLVNVVPLLDLDVDPAVLERRGNSHPFFVPVGVYAASDGHVLLAVGSDRQWTALTECDGFGGLARPARADNHGRLADRDAIDAELRAAIATEPSAPLVERWRAAGLVAAPVRTVAEAAEALDAAGWLAATTHPDGSRVRLAGPGAGAAAAAPLPFAPTLGADTDAVLREAGFDAGECAALRDAGVIA